MRRYEAPLTDDAVLLDQYLLQYRACISKKKSLEARRRDILLEFDSPLSAISMDGMPRGSGENLGCAALSFRLDEIDTRIKEQMDKSAKVLTEIMDVIDFLPESSVERSIVEHRYIDRMSWNRICQKEHISRTPATRYWKKGLYALLEFKKIQQIVNDFSKAQGELI